MADLRQHGQRSGFAFPSNGISLEEKKKAAAFVRRETMATIIAPFTPSPYYAVLRVLSVCYFEF